MESRETLLIAARRDHARDVHVVVAHDGPHPADDARHVLVGHVRHLALGHEGDGELPDLHDARMLVLEHGAGDHELGPSPSVTIKRMRLR